MAIAVKKIDGEEIKHIVDAKGKVTVVHYTFVDDFTSDGIAAAQNKKGMWHIINRDGKRVGNIEASSNLEALDKHMMDRFKIEGKRSEKLETRALALLEKNNHSYTAVHPLKKEGTFLVEAEIDGKIKK